jgi:hypothetical protein
MGKWDGSQEAGDRSQELTPIAQPAINAITALGANDQKPQSPSGMFAIATKQTRQGFHLRQSCGGRPLVDERKITARHSRNQTHRTEGNRDKGDLCSLR